MFTCFPGLTVRFLTEGAEGGRARRAGPRARPNPRVLRISAFSVREADVAIGTGGLEGASAFAMAAIC